VAWLIALATLLALAGAGAYFAYRLVRGAPFEDPGRRH
jgi:hypothetical protein